MCLLSYYEPGTRPDVDRLDRGAIYNSDGFGYAIVAKGELIVGKSMKATELIDEFATLRDIYPDGPAMFHSRLATGGVEDEYNCHPFEVGNNPQTVVAHNGIFFAVPKGERRSDTRIFAESILPRRYPVLDSKRTQRRLRSYLGVSNKLAILTVDPAHKSNGYLFNEHLGDWVAPGEWQSNTSHEPRMAITSKPAWAGEDAAAWWAEREIGGWGYDPDPTECLACRSYGTIVAGNYCEACDACQDCGWDVTDCQCYTPAVLGLKSADSPLTGSGWCAD